MTTCHACNDSGYIVRPDAAGQPQLIVCPEQAHWITSGTSHAPGNDTTTPTPKTRIERYHCPVCSREWDQEETWDEDAQDWAFSAEPYGFCRVCTPNDDI